MQNEGSSIDDLMREFEEVGWYERSEAEELLLALESKIGVDFPSSYRQFFLHSCEGIEICRRTSIYFFGNPELTAWNFDSDDWTEQLPGMFFWGQDGDYVYFFDVKGQWGRGPWAVFSAALSAMVYEDSRFIATGFADCLRRILDGEDFLDYPLFSELELSGR